MADGLDAAEGLDAQEGLDGAHEVAGAHEVHEVDAAAMWRLFEPVHAVVYFTPQARERFEAAGLRGFWRGYFAGRAAPLGAVGAAPVTALFFGFSPALTERALPAIWSLAAPDVALRARQEAAEASLEAVLTSAGLDPDGEQVAQAAEIARQAARAAATDGRALGAANAALPWPDRPLAVLWQAATVLRELRGDGHVAALVAAGLSGLESLVLRCGVDMPRALMQPARGWTDEEWSDAAAGLRERGLLDDADRATDTGRNIVAGVESITDRLAAPAWRAVGPEAAGRFAEAAAPVSAAALAAIPSQIPIGRLRG